MKITELGEFGLIEHLRQILPRPGGDVVLGIGDDVAVLQAGPNDDQYWLAISVTSASAARWVSASMP